MKVKYLNNKLKFKSMNKIAQGAEAVIYQKDNIIIKERIQKNYRISEIDGPLRRSRTRREAKVLQKLENFPAPQLLEFSDKEMTIKMELIPGEKVRDIITETNYVKIGQEIGKKVAQLHNMDIIHGDLTTSNMILNDEIYFIDFGLSSFSDKIEHKAVDLYLLERALESKHYQFNIFEHVLKSYKKEALQDISKRFEQVSLRGRNKAK
jgi:Kae1-associated kinase Bud32